MSNVTEREKSQESVSVVCFLWNDGVRNYLPDHVNRLADMIDKHLSFPHRFICITDEEEGFNDNVEVFRLPDSARWTLALLNPTGSKKGRLPSSYRRLWLFSQEAAVLGDQILMLDVDCLIMSSLDPIFEFTENFVGWRPRSEETTKVKANVPYKRIGGGTWLLRTGTMTHIWDTFSAEGIEAAKEEGWRGSDQAWLSYNLAKDCMVFPDEIGIYHTQDGAKHWESVPEDATIIHFNGKVNPWDEDAQSRPWFCRLIGVPYNKKRWEQVRIQKRRRPRPIQTDRLDIVLFWWGNWPNGNSDLGSTYIVNLVSALKRHMPDTVDYRVILFTDDPSVAVDGVDVRTLEVPNGLRWNLKKMFMYSDQADLRKHILCLDLDCIVVGDMSPLVAQVLSLNQKLLITCAGAYKRNKLGGSVIGFKTGSKLRRLLWDPLMGEKRSYYEDATKGSERKYLQRMLSPRQVGMWDKYLPNAVLSYKRDCQNRLPAGASVVRFHGKPRPHQVEDQWVQENWI